MSNIDVNAILSAAELGDSQAQMAYAAILEFGLGGIPRDEAKALEYWRQAASDNDGFAAITMARLTARGIGCKSDVEEAKRWLLAAADAGFFAPTPVPTEGFVELDGDAVDPEPRTTPLAVQNIIRGQGRKVLVVDDSVVILEQVSQWLKQWGYEPLTAKDGQIGLQRLLGNPSVVLVMSDVVMPVMDGLTMVESIRKQESFKDLPVVMLTTEGNVESIQRAKKLGVSGYILKPANMEHVAMMVNKVIGGK
jgi:two-component system chemotaxis response regulator CheY